MTLDFGNGVIRENFIKYWTYFMDTTAIMLQLKAEVVRLGIPIVQCEVQTFEEIQTEAIFNYSGLSAKSLSHDELMVPVRGHLINLNERAGESHVDYMIYTKVTEPNGEEAYVYMFPKCLQVSSAYPDGKKINGTLGGMFIPIRREMTADEYEALDQNEFKKNA